MRDLPQHTVPSACALLRLRGWLGLYLGVQRAPACVSQRGWRRSGPQQRSLPLWLPPATLASLSVVLPVQVIGLCEKPRDPPLKYIVADTPGQIEVRVGRSACGQVRMPSSAVLLGPWGVALRVGGGT